LKLESSRECDAQFAPSADRHYLENMTEKPKRPRAASQLAKFIVDVATGSPAPVVLDESGKHGSGAAGGTAQAVALTKDQRKEAARIAADARWKKG